jgi:hypothetical protein
MIGRGTRFIYEAIATGKIEAVKSNKRTLVVVASLHQYVDELRRDHPAKIKPMTRSPKTQGRRVTKKRAPKSLAMAGAL